MAELRELFEMTTRQMEPDQDSWRKQQREQDRSSRKRRIGAMLVAAVLAGLVVVAVLVATLTDAGRPAPEVADQPKPSADGIGGAGLSSFTLDLASGESGERTPMPAELTGASLFAISPDGERVAYGTCCLTPDFITVVGLDGSNSRQVTPDGIDAYGPSWSPDGKQLVYQGRDGTTYQLGDLFVVDVSTGSVHRITHLPTSSSGGWSMMPSFTPDGERILFHMPRQGSGSETDLWSVDAHGGKPRIVLRNATFGQYSPDGSSLAYVLPTRDGVGRHPALRVVLPSGQVRTLARGEEIRRERWSPDGTRIAYVERDFLFVVDVATGDIERVAEGEYGDWIDDDRLMVIQGG
jgi:dipeptidyl aminopeptidase/acylaminoacyl peptidase